MVLNKKALAAGALGEKIAKKGVSAGGESLNDLAERLSHLAGSLTALAQQGTDRAPAQLRQAPKVLRRRAETVASAVTALPEELKERVEPARNKARATGSKAKSALDGAVSTARRPLSVRLDRKRLLLVAASLMTLALGTGLASRLLRRRKKNAEIDALADRAEAGENPVRYGAAGDDGALVARNGIARVGRPGQQLS